MIFVVVLIILCNQSVASSKCNRSCPPDKPYCNDVVGCIFECPEPFYISGNNCVSDCGEMFVDEHRNCIGSCPENTFYKETLKQSMSMAYLERKCVRCDKFDDIVSNASCVKACPSDSRYIDKQNCVSECPNDRPYRMNTTIFGLLHHKCVGKCPRMEDDGFCRTSCPQNKMAFNSTCYEQCPSLSPFIFSKTCLSKCPDDAPAAGLDNKTCVHQKCPDERQFVVNSTCIDKCPSELQFIFSTYDGNSGFKYCVEDCGDKYKFGDQCVDSCPQNKMAFNSTCYEQCPSLRPFIFSITCLSKCPDDAPAAGLDNKTCVHQKCPDERPVVVNSTCVDKCPSELHFIFSTYDGNSGFKYCVENCGDKYKFGDQCVDTCPLSTKAVNNTCLEKCPKNKSYSCMIKKGFQCGEKPEQNVDHTICVDVCPLSMLSWNKTCVSSCPSGVPLFGRECTEKCPEGYPYKQNITKTTDCIFGWCDKVESVLTCIKICPSESYISNYSCLSYCPSSLILKGRDCVLKCPVSKPIIQNVTITLHDWSYHDRTQYLYRHYSKKESKKIIQKCVAVCDKGMVHFNSTCVALCPDDYPVIHNGTCSQHKCATKYSENISTGIICIDECKPRQFVWNKTCVDTCPDINLHFNGTCVEQCPRGHSYIGISVRVETCQDDYYCSGNIIMNNCIAKCPDGSFEYNGTCVSFCNPPLFTFESKCVASCPEGAPYPETSSISITSWTWSYDGIHIRKNNAVKKIIKCRENCPNDKVLLGTKCIDMCPLRARYVINGSCTSDNCKTRYKLYTLPGIKCFDECPHGLFIHNNSCVLQCPEDLYVLARNCISVCPSTHLIVNNKIIGKEQYNCTNTLCAKGLINVKECREKCPENKFLFNKRCQDICLNNTLIYKNTCVQTCPTSHTYTEPVNISILKWKSDYSKNWYLTSEKRDGNMCVSKCSNKYPLQINNFCVNKCTDEGPYSLDNKCVENCPENKLTDIKTKQCVDNCANDRGYLNKSCHYNCPEKFRYIFDSRCVSKCPSSDPVALKEERFICRKSCDGSKVFKDGECIYNFECKDPMFAFDGLCIHRCPEGFVWFDNCKNTMPAKIAIPVLVVLLALLFAASRQSLIDFVYVLRLLFVSKEMIKKKEEQLKQPRSRNKNETTERDDEIPLQDFFLHTENYIN